MDASRLKLVNIEGEFAVCRLAPDEAIPTWAMSGVIFSITRTGDELSIVCSGTAVPPEVRCERGWHCFRVLGPIPFTQTGVLTSLVRPLSDARIGVFAISTFDTDYLLVKASDRNRTRIEWQKAGHTVDPV